MASDSALGTPTMRRVKPNRHTVRLRCGTGDGKDLPGLTYTAFQPVTGCTRTTG